MISERKGGCAGGGDEWKIKGKCCIGARKSPQEKISFTLNLRVVDVLVELIPRLNRETV